MAKQIVRVNDSLFNALFNDYFGPLGAAHQVSSSTDIDCGSWQEYFEKWALQQGAEVHDSMTGLIVFRNSYQAVEYLLRYG